MPMAESGTEQSRERERRHPHGWGDLRTWLILGVLIGGGIVHTFVIHSLVGDRVEGPEQWNLGYPPTSPN